MLDQLINALLQVFIEIQENAVLALMAVGVLWGIQCLNFLTRYKLNCLGLYPRHISGLPGIVFSPFLHGSFTHLLFNSIPFFVLLDFILLNGITFTVKLTAFIVIVSGVLLWLFGRKGIHVGASGLIMGYLSYLLVNAYQHPSVKSIILGIITVYYFGSLLFSIFPQEEKVSAEGHLFGLLAGLAAVFFF